MIAQTLRQSLVDVLPAVHAISGCDSTSCYIGKGTILIYKLVKAQPVLQNKFSQIVNDLPIPATIKGMVFKLYGLTKNSINRARYDVSTK